MAGLSRFVNTDTIDRDPRRVAHGLNGFAVGLIMIAVAVVLATMPGITGWKRWESWELAGVVGGIGAQLVAISVYILTPTHRVERPRTRLVALGTILTLVGVAVFVHVFPNQWVRTTPNNAWMVAVTYLPGAALTYIAIAHSIIRYKIRTNPGGTISMLFGGEPDQTDEQSHPTPPQQTTPPSPEPPESTGNATPPESVAAGMDDAEIVDGDSRQSRGPGQADPYCGSCEHFEYRKGTGDFVPYCTLMDRPLESMDACEDWTPMADGEEFDHSPQMIEDDYTEVRIDDGDDGARRL